jgi:hypothetical protein
MSNPQVPVIGDDKSTRSNSADSSISSKSRGSFFSRIFNQDPANHKKVQTKEQLREKLLAQLDHHASYDKDVREKNGGGLAGAKGLGH